MPHQENVDITKSLFEQPMLRVFYSKGMDFLFSCINAVFSSRTRAEHTFEKVLIIKLSALGDVLAFSPIPRLIKQHSAVEVHHLVMESCADATKYNPFVDKQIVIPNFPSSSIKNNIMVIFNLIITLRAQNYQKAIIFHRNFFFQLLCKVAGVRLIFGYTSSKNIFLTQYLDYKFNINRTLQDASLLKLSGYKTPFPKKLEFYFPNNKIDVTCFGIPEIYVAINPGGGNFHSPADNRIWPMEKYIDLIEKLKKPVVLLGHGASDESRCNFIEKNIRHGEVINLSGRTSLLQAAIILKKAILYVGNDSAMIFLSSALGTPYLGIYGPTQVEACFPIGKNGDYLMSQVSCSPCYNPFDGMSGSMYVCKNNVCMQSVEVDIVLEKAKNLLNLIKK
jgi:heptosyltransferase-2